MRQWAQPIEAMPVARLVTLLMRPRRKSETPEEHWERLLRKGRRKTAVVAMDDAAVDRMIRQSIEQYGP